MIPMRFLIAATVVAGLAGCATDGTSPEATEDSLAAVNSQSAFGYESPDWGTPFWERLREKTDRALASAPAARPVAPDAQSVGDSDFAKADSLNPTPNEEPVSPYAGTPAIVTPNAAPVRSTNPGTLNLHPSIALAWQGTGSTPAAVTTLEERLAAAGFVVTPPQALMDAIGDAPDCDTLTRPTCLATLARYPAPRLLMVIEPGSGNQLQLTTYDTQFGARYNPSAFDASNPADDRLATIASAAERRVAVAPWFTRSFAERDGLYYLSAGAASGLSVGDRLQVHTAGELVRGPSGQPVVWQPGTVNGTVEIEQLLGADTSRARPIDGVRVTPGALLVAGSESTTR